MAGTDLPPPTLAGLSRHTVLLVLCNAVVWLVYAVLTQAWWAGAPSLFTIPLVIFMLVLQHRGRAAQLVAPDDGATGAFGTVLDAQGCACGWIDDDVPHSYFVTAPPGYGTVLDPCPGGNLVQGHPVRSRCAVIDA